MHIGGFKNLEEVIDFYNDGGDKVIFLNNNNQAF
jgi:hypothetical protein